MKRLRCAIYTRKSSEEGLEQDFNSLHAQREACEAYIKSQAGEGWAVVRSRYDDGGISGGTLDRPALQLLLADIRARKVDTVVVYKVDRLTRALADFAKIVEVFDAHGVSFVSVTQQFNTTTSMGRLTLNMLLSFAQFEREVTAERIRDKIAASKRKGLWMGGVVPLGYDVEERKLVVNAAEAETVRTLFRLYLDLGDVTRVQQEALHRGLRTKARKPNNGKRPGGAPFTRGHLYKLLANPIYIGEISHKGHRYPGAHKAIVDRETWEAVQAGLERNAVTRRSPSNAKAPSLLTGLIYDGEGRPMRPSHATKAGRRYRYYVSRLPEDAASESPAAWRIPAPALEDAVLTGLGSFLLDRRRLTEVLCLANSSSSSIQTIHAKSARLGRRVRDAGPAEQRDLFVELIARIDIRPDGLGISLRAGLLWGDLGEEFAKRIAACDPLRLDIPIRLKRRGVETKLVLTDERLGAATQDPNLIAVVTQGHRWFEEIRSGVVPSVDGLVRRHNVDQGDVSRTLPLAFLAPDIVEAILRGRQPVELTAALLKRMRLPLSWIEQRRSLGFTA